MAIKHRIQSAPKYNEKDFEKALAECKALMAKEGKKFTRVRYGKDEWYLTIAFRIDMDDVPEDLISKLLDIGQKHNVPVEPCKDVSGGGIRWL